MNYEKKIPLLEKDKNTINLAESSINDFISFYQCQIIDITDENVIDLNYLSKEYEIPQLKDITDQYIKRNDKILLKLYVFNLNVDQLNNEIYEEAISQRLTEFINNDDLLNLPIFSMHRILEKNDNLNDHDKFNFLLKCLKKYDKSASILFHKFNFDGDNKKYLITILNDIEYSTKIDLRYIDPTILISIYQQQESEIETLKRQLIEKEPKQEIIIITDFLKVRMV